MHALLKATAAASVLFLLSSILTSCTILYIPYIRNSRNEITIVRFSLQNPPETEPGYFPLAHNAVEFRKKFTEEFTDSLAAVRINATTWEIAIPARSTVKVPSNFYSYAGLKAYHTVVSIIKGNTADTVYDYSRTKPIDRFHYKSYGARISPKICYYDISD